MTHPMRIASNSVHLAASLAGVLLGAQALATDWPSWRGVNRDGITPEVNWNSDWPADGPTRVWKANVGVGFSSMVVADGRLFTMGWETNQDRVTCLDAVTGIVQWTYTYPEALADKMYEGGPNSTPLVVGSRVFTASKMGNLHCFDAATGKVLWNLDLGKTIGASVSMWGISGAPVLANAETLLVNYGPQGVAVNPTTGKQLWDSGKKKDMSFTAPVIASLDGKDTALFHMSEELVAVDPATGKTLWKSKFGQGYRTHCSDPIVSGDRIFISSGDDGGELLQISNGAAKRVWKNKNLSTFTGTAVLIDGHLYGHETGGYKKDNQELRCLDFASGEIKWGEKGFGQGSIIASGNRLIVLAENGELSIVRANPGRFELISRTQAIGGKCWTSPILANGRLYVRNAKGDLVCLDVRPKQTASLPATDRTPL